MVIFPALLKRFEACRSPEWFLVLSATNYTPYAMSKVWTNVEMDFTVSRSRKAERTNLEFLLQKRLYRRIEEAAWGYRSTSLVMKHKDQWISTDCALSTHWVFLKLQNYDGRHLKTLARFEEAYRGFKWCLRTVAWCACHFSGTGAMASSEPAHEFIWSRECEWRIKDAHYAAHW